MKFYPLAEWARMLRDPDAVPYREVGGAFRAGWFEASSLEELEAKWAAGLFVMGVRYRPVVPKAGLGGIGILWHFTCGVTSMDLEYCEDTAEWWAPRGRHPTPEACLVERARDMLRWSWQLLEDHYRTLGVCRDVLRQLGE